MTAEYHSKICAIAHSAMAELFSAGLLDPQSMREFDLLCRTDVSSDPQGSAMRMEAVPADPLSLPDRPAKQGAVMPQSSPAHPSAPMAAQHAGTQPDLQSARPSLVATVAGPTLSNVNDRRFSARLETAHARPSAPAPAAKQHGLTEPLALGKR